MWIQQVGYAFIMLVLITGILCLLGILIFNISKNFSGLLFKEDDSKFLNIAFAGTILIALSQLFGPLVATTYPIICGPDANDYSLSLDNVYSKVSYNSTSGNYSFAATTDSLGQDYHGKEMSIPFEDRSLICNRISATNLNPLMSYDNQIFLSISAPDGIITSLSRPVIKVGQSSNLTILFVGRPDIGLYPIKVRGTGGDGKIREAMMVIEISFLLPTGTGMSGYGGSYVYDTDACDSIVLSPTSGGTVYTPTRTSGSAVYTPTRPINITFFSSLNQDPWNYSSSSYSDNTGSYTPSYSDNTGSYTPSYSDNTGSYTPSYSGNSRQV